MMALANKNDKRAILNIFKYLKENMNIKRRKEKIFLKNAKYNFLGLKTTATEVGILLNALKNILDTINEEIKSVKLEIY